ncbi:MAG: LLM class flavin-dependent oxidoreductase [Acidimicrobiia bacterium]|jgi:alkanesulfonate monooxygenase SsuD/methylene tetrahydromethanopterin reductase-like flavin-dependent oxidoreductase (luciferase family)
MGAPRVGLTLPSFVRDPDEVFAVVEAAEAAGLDGVFCYDHIFRVAADGSHRPALESTALLGAVASMSSRLFVGSLVIRASLRPAALTALTLSTVNRIAGGRVIGAIGAGDSESERENEQFGLEFGSMDDRMTELRTTVRTTRDQGFPVWVGGLHRDVRALAAAEADGWNRWGGDVDRFREQAAGVTAAAVRHPFECSWGGLVVTDRDDDAARVKAERLGAGPGTLVGGPANIAAAFAEYADAGAAWVIAGPVDARDPANAAVLAEVKTHLGV